MRAPNPNPNNRTHNAIAITTTSCAYFVLHADKRNTQHVDELVFYTFFPLLVDPFPMAMRNAQLKVLQHSPTLDISHAHKQKCSVLLRAITRSKLKNQ